MDNVYLGTKQAYPITIEADGFNMSTGEWSVRCIVRANSVTCDKVRQGGQWHFILDTSALGVGVCICVVEYTLGGMPKVYKENLVNILDYARV